MARRRVRVHYGVLISRLLTLALIIYGVYWGVGRALDWMARTHAEPETVQISRQGSGIILREEARIYTQNGGTVTYLVQDGEKVQKGQKIAEILVSQSALTEAASEQYGVAAILAKDRQQLELLTQEIEKLMDAVAEGVRNQKLVGIPGLKMDLSLKLAEQNRLKDEISALEEGQKPQESATGDVAAKAGQTIEIRSPGEGIVSYYTDGLEDVLKPPQYRSINWSTVVFKEPSGVGVPEISVGALLYKLADTSVWYMLLPVNPGDGAIIKPTQTVTLKAADTTLQANVKDVIVNGDQTVLMLEIHSIVPGFHKNRQMAVELMIDQYQGLRVPQGAIVKINEQSGVIVVKDNGALQFMPVESLKETEGYTVVAQNVFYAQVNGHYQEKATLRKGDTILRKPRSKDVAAATQE